MRRIVKARAGVQYDLLGLSRQCTWWRQWRTPISLPHAWSVDSAANLIFGEVRR